jgi:hypothetical protein
VSERCSCVRTTLPTSDSGCGRPGEPQAPPMRFNCALFVHLFMWYVLAGADQRAAVTPPIDDPVASFFASAGATAVPEQQRLDASWFPWSNIIVASAAEASSDPAKAYATAAAAVLKANPLGGVVYFPPATYKLTETLSLVDGVILRGAPTGANSASNGPKGPGPLMPSTVFEFPDRSYSRFSCVNCTVAGVISVLSDGAGVELNQRTDATVGSRTMFLVLSNMLRHVVYKYPVAPPATFYQEWPYRFSTAVAVTATENALIANNLLAKATRVTKVKVSFLPTEKSIQKGNGLPADIYTPATRSGMASCSVSITLHHNFTVDVSNKGVRSEVTHVDATGDLLTAACCERCRNDTYCIGFQAHQTGKHGNCVVYECPTDKSPNCTLSLAPWAAPKTPTHKNQPPTAGLWTGPPRPRLPPKHPAKPPHPPPAPPHPPPAPPHPHPPPAPPKENCSLTVEFAYDNRCESCLPRMRHSSLWGRALIFCFYIAMEQMESGTSARTRRRRSSMSASSTTTSIKTVTSFKAYPRTGWVTLAIASWTVEPVRHWTADLLRGLCPVLDL